MIYVGITDRRERRASEHASSKDWWQLTAGCVIEHYPTREEALAREEYLIKALCPAFNTVHNPIKNQTSTPTYVWPKDFDLLRRRAVYASSSEKVQRTMPCIKCNGPRLAQADFRSPLCTRCRMDQPKRQGKKRTDLMVDELEHRSVPFSLVRNSEEGDGLTLAGYAAVFNSPTTINERGMTFTEVIAPGAFSKAINARAKVVLQFDHGQHPVIGSMPLGRIEDMRQDSHGLYVEARLSDNWMTKPVRDAIADGAIDGMSFRFSVPANGDSWDRTGDMPVRTLHEVKLFELGPVVFPAYASTAVAVRSALDLLNEDERRALADDLRRDEIPTHVTARSDVAPVMPPAPEDGEAPAAAAEEAAQGRTMKARQALVRVSAPHINISQGA